MALLSLIAKLGLDKTGFDAGMNSATNQVSKFGGTLKSQLAGAFSVAAITAFVKHVADYAERIGDVQDVLGTGAEAAQQWSLAAKLNGKDADFVSQKILNTASSLERARQGNEESIEAFRKMGVSLQDIRTKNPEEIFRMMAKSIAESGISADNTAAAVELFGRGAAKMLLILRDFESLGGMNFMDQSQIDQLKEANDEIDKMSNRLTILGGKVLSGLSQGFAYFRNKIKGMSDEDAALLAVGADKALSTKPNAAQIESETAAQTDRESHSGNMDRLLAIYKEIEKVQFNALSNEAKINQLIERREAVFNEIAGMPGNTPDDDLRLNRLRLERLQLDEQIKNLEPKPEKAKEIAKENFSIPSDSLGRIGGKIGSGNSIPSKLDKQNRTLEKIVRHFERGVKIQDL